MHSIHTPLDGTQSGSNGTLNLLSNVPLGSKEISPKSAWFNVHIHCWVVHYNLTRPVMYGLTRPVMYGPITRPVMIGLITSTMMYGLTRPVRFDHLWDESEMFMNCHTCCHRSHLSSTRLHDWDDTTMTTAEETNRTVIACFTGDECYLFADFSVSFTGSYQQ